MDFVRSNFGINEPLPVEHQKDNNLALNSGIHTYQILTNDDEVCIPSLSSILLALKPKVRGLMELWDHRGVWPKVSLVIEDFKFKISETGKL